MSHPSEEAPAGLASTPAELAARARAEMAWLAYPDRSWVLPAPARADGRPVWNVVIVGAGQSGLALAARLRRDGVDRVLLLDGAAPGEEGVWENFARMPELRTPKALNGMDMGLASLSVQAWYRARFGESAWQAIDRIPRTAWAEYLRWYRQTLDLVVHNGQRVVDVGPAEGEPGGLLEVQAQDSSATGPQQHLARCVVLATGFDGAGAWRVPAMVSAALPAGRYHHSAEAIDFSRLAGLRLGVLGHGASAFDNAVAALRAGAASVDLCFRRAQLPYANPHRHVETAGFMQHFHALDDAIRWQVALHFRQVDQPPPRASFEAALGLPGLRVRAACPWDAVHEVDGPRGREIAVTTPHGELRLDHLVCATGQTLDLAARPELKTLAPQVARWRDRFAPAADSGPGDAPYLGPHFEFQERQPGQAPWVARVFAFNSASHPSHGPHCSSISGHKHSLPLVVQGLTRRLFLDQAPRLLPDLQAYAETDLRVPQALAQAWLPQAGPRAEAAEVAKVAEAELPDHPPSAPFPGTRAHAA